MYPCPKNSEWYLDHKYGNDWLTPKIKYGPRKKFQDGQDNSWNVMPQHFCPAAVDSHKFKVLTKFIHALDSIDCPYNIHAGTLLNFVRDCELTV